VCFGVFLDLFLEEEIFDCLTDGPIISSSYGGAFLMAANSRQAVSSACAFSLRKAIAIPL